MVEMGNYFVLFVNVNIKKKLEDLGLNSNNSIVIGSGILNALNLRESKDIDVVVTEKLNQNLKEIKSFGRKFVFGREILADNLFEISIDWWVLGKSWKFKDLLENSTIIDGVRYIAVEFLLDVKRSWVTGDEVVRQKDIDDVKLIEDYLGNVGKVIK